MKPNIALKRERERRSWSQARVAREIGIDPQSVSRWERGASQPYPMFREKLCALFGKNAEELGLLQEGEKETSRQPMLRHYAPAIASPSISTEPFFDPAIPPTQTESGTLLGRSELLDQIKQRLMREEGRSPVILQGLPGAGKTTLAVAVAHDAEIREQFQDGILWASMGPTPNLLEQIRRWGMLLHCTVPEKNGLYEEWGRLLHAHLEQQRILFILDDAWELATILALKIGGSRCAYLITTRIPRVAYYFASEEVWRVPELQEKESLALLACFIPELVEEEKVAIEELVQAVGGLPLALTMIGRYLRMQVTMGQPRRVHNVLRQMASARVRLLLSEPYGLIEQRTYQPEEIARSLYSVIATSEQRIKPEERYALRALAVFPAKPSTFSEEAALAVCQVMVEVLDGLSDSGLLESAEPHRYYLHQTIADYARTYLADDQEIVQRFVDYIVQFIENHRFDYNQLELERSNILAALEQARHFKLQSAYVRGVLAFVPFLEVCGLYDLAIEHLQQVYHMTRTLQDIPHQLLALIHLGHITREHHLLFQAEAYLREGLRYADQYRDNKMMHHLLFDLAEVMEIQGDYVQAQRYRHEGLKLNGYPLNERQTFYQLIPVKYQEETMCVHFTEPLNMMRRGYLADIDVFFRAWRYADALSPTRLKILTGTDGHLYGIPVDAYVMCLAYNRRIFREAGLDPDGPPASWGEFRAYARRVTNPRKGVYGFAMETIDHQGGWHFTNWLYTAGGLAQQYQNGGWKATFNDERGIQFLQMLKEMRFRDGSIPRHVLLRANDAFDLLRTGKVAMIVATPHIIRELYSDKDVDLNDIGLAPMPQNGGNACLMGGAAYVFNAQSSSSSLKVVFEQVVAKYFTLDDYEAHIRAAARAGEAVGVPHNAIFTKKLRQQHAEIEAKYVNVPQGNYRPFTESKLQLIQEPAIEAQKYYRMLDPIVQAILTNPHVQPDKLLNTAAQQFQERFLDHLTLSGQIGSDVKISLEKI